MNKEIGSVINSPIKEKQKINAFPVTVYQTLNEEIKSILILFNKIEKERLFPNSFYESSSALTPNTDRDTTR